MIPKVGCCVSTRQERFVILRDEQVGGREMVESDDGRVYCEEFRSCSWPLLHTKHIDLVLHHPPKCHGGDRCLNVRCGKTALHWHAPCIAEFTLSSALYKMRRAWFGVFSNEIRLTLRHIVHMYRKKNTENQNKYTFSVINIYWQPMYTEIHVDILYFSKDSKQSSATSQNAEKTQSI